MTRAQDDAHYAKLITDYLTKFGEASRRDIDELLWRNLSEALTEEQKGRKIAGLLTNLRRAGSILNTGSRAHPVWRRAESMQKRGGGK